ncbi:hypothetical protein QYM36_013841 [Artemia franciscana]|uniref:Uncharacterized protein n=1 Tax=Artemia franciscana TaxID=6661 RepID=A0AA88KZ79_ARTSF|nr:hypothetical protein QYM36_013841 [Artemia franciscana]
MGGLKAVMWTDTFQVIIMYGSMIAVCIIGDADVGGPSEVVKRNNDTQRIEFFEFNPNPAIRHSFWSLVIGGYFQWVTIYGVNQSQVQRYLSVPSIKQAQRAIWINLVGLLGLLCICCYTGMVIFTKYYDCDPLSANLVERSEQLFPLFVMDTLGHLPGLPGLFVAGIFSGALSPSKTTVSSGLNSLAAIAMEDFVKPFCFPNLSDRAATNVSKTLAVLFGLICFGLVFVAAQFGNALEVSISLIILPKYNQNCLKSRKIVLWNFPNIIFTIKLLLIFQ